jgi:hypothetical protein
MKESICVVVFLFFKNVIPAIPTPGWGRIDSLESILGLLKSLKMQALLPLWTNPSPILFKAYSTSLRTKTTLSKVLFFIGILRRKTSLSYLYPLACKEYKERSWQTKFKENVHCIEIVQCTNCMYNILIKYGFKISLKM